MPTWFLFKPVRWEREFGGKNEAKKKKGLSLERREEMTLTPMTRKEEKKGKKEDFSSLDEK